MTVCIAAAFCWMLAPVASWRARILGCLVLFGSVVSTDFARSDAGQLFFVLCSYYACYLAGAFVALGVFIRLVLYPEPAVSRRIQLGGGVSAILAFALGAQSLRQTLVCYLPLLFIAVLLWLYGGIRQRKGKPGTPAHRLVVFAAVLLAANLAGVFLASRLHPAQSVIVGTTGSGLSSRFGMCCSAVSRLVGIGPGHAGDALAATDICAFAFIAVAIFGACLGARQRSKAMIPLALFALGFAGVAVAGLVLGLSLRSVYFFFWFPLVACAAVILVDSMQGSAQNVVATVLCMLLATNWMVCYRPSFEQAIGSASTPAEVQNNRQVADWLMGSDYELLYGKWNPVARIAAMTDGKLVAAAWHEELVEGRWRSVPFAVLSYINPQNLYTEEDNRRAVYLIRPEEKEMVLEEIRKRGANFLLVQRFEDSGYELYVSDIQLMHPR